MNRLIDYDLVLTSGRGKDYAAHTCTRCIFREEGYLSDGDCTPHIPDCSSSEDNLTLGGYQVFALKHRAIGTIHFLEDMEAIRGKE